MKLPAVLPDAFLRCLSPADRKTFAAGQLTLPEVIAKAGPKFERELQGQIVGLLRLRGIEPLWFRTDKRSRATVGWPDITFAVNGQAVAWEVKLPGAEPRPEQKAMHARLLSNGWDIEVITTLPQAKSELACLERQAGTEAAN